ncbi:MAG: ATP-binding cassette domain-containing protein [Clostridia bacterium]|nr:ATP-binding cassette domain-containing protein [Clostridia bacterium]
MQICVENLNKEFTLKSGKMFGQKTKTIVKAVEDVSFKVKKGEIIAFIGPNGAGKSTTIKMLTGIIRPTRGQIRVAGLDPTKDRKQLAYKIGCMFGQKSQLYMHLTVRDSYKLLCSIYDLNAKQAEEKIEEIATLFDIHELLDKVVRKLSLGQRMICEIAGSVLNNPEIIFLDEPTIGLDIFAKAKIRDIIRKMNEEKGTTIFLTSHDVGDVEALCNRIIIINNGTIVTDSTIEELKSKYLSKKIIKISYDRAINNKKLEYNVQKINHNQVELIVDTTKTNLGDLLSYFTSVGNIVDIQIESTPLEDVIKNIYKERR